MNAKTNTTLQAEAGQCTLKARILELIGEGSTLTEACQALSVSNYQVFRWRNDDPTFDHAYEQAHRAGTSKMLADIDEQLARPGLTRRKRRFLKKHKRAVRRGERLKALINGWQHPNGWQSPDKKARRLKAVAKKLRWLSGQNVEAMSPEARRAAGRLLRSKQASEILRAWGCEPASSN